MKRQRGMLEERARIRRTSNAVARGLPRLALQRLMGSYTLSQERFVRRFDAALARRAEELKAIKAFQAP
uniref:Uncharacterized protein n=1 Tax=Caenorhabditis japonica TaxID=281687 RepID=A0A8R1IG22_CAEJA